MTSISKPAISHPFKKEEKTFVLMGKKRVQIGWVGWELPRQKTDWQFILQLKTKLINIKMLKLLNDVFQFVSEKNIH